MCDDLGIDPVDPVVLVIAYHFKAEVMGVFNQSEFIQGMKNLGCDSIQKLRNKLPELRSSLSDPEKFRSIYNYVFLFSRDIGCRNLNLDVAIAMWRLLLAEKFPFIQKWFDFLEKREKRHDISKDTWEMLLDFLNIIQKNGISGYDPNSAWPILIDEFVEVLNSP
jgi:DCN1-like protein 1/2